MKNLNMNATQKKATEYLVELAHPIDPTRVIAALGNSYSSIVTNQGRDSA